MSPSIIVWRLLVGIGGGYAFTFGLVSAVTAGASRLGLRYDDAWLLAAMLAFPVLLLAVLWAFVCSSQWRVVFVLVTGAAVFTALAWAVVRFAPAIS